MVFRVMVSLRKCVRISSCVFLQTVPSKTLFLIFVDFINFPSYVLMLQISTLPSDILQFSLLDLDVCSFD